MGANVNSDVYVVATLKPWNIKIYNEKIKHYPGEWHLITEPNELTVEKIRALNPRYIFFPHWSDIVDDEILKMVECVCFHETDLPYGRGGSPIQNLIARGHKETVVTAFRMTSELDAGPIYLKRKLSLEGLAEEIFIRASRVVADMIRLIVTENIMPIEQTGKATFFKRRTPQESEISLSCADLHCLFDHIRMLDADGYPRAFFERGGFRYEMTRPALKADHIVADVKIYKTDG